MRSIIGKAYALVLFYDAYLHFLSLFCLVLEIEGKKNPAKLFSRKVKGAGG